MLIEYGGIECGEIKIIIKKNVQTFEFYFDELLDDPLPDLVKFFNAVRGGEDYFEINIMLDDGRIAFKLSIKSSINDQVHFYVDLVGESLTLHLRREELTAMFKKIFDALLNDKYFPYSYPCYGNIHEEDNLYDELIDEAKKYPNWSFGDVLNHAAEAGQLKLSTPYEKYLEHYRKMLTDYVIPDKWFE